MTIARLITPAARASLMVTVGAVLINVPLVLGLSAAAFAVGVLLGGLAFYVGLAGASEGRGSLSVTATADFDRGLAIGLLVATAGFAVVGETIAAGIFGAGALVMLAIAGFTRYVVSPAT